MFDRSPHFLLIWGIVVVKARKKPEIIVYEICILSFLAQGSIPMAINGWFIFIFILKIIFNK